MIPPQEGNFLSMRCTHFKCFVTPFAQQVLSGTHKNASSGNPLLTVSIIIAIFICVTVIFRMQPEVEMAAS